MDLNRLKKANLINMIQGRSMEFRVLSLVDSLGELSEANKARAELAITLARELDDPPERPSTAAVSKELRAVLDQLEGIAQGDDDPTAGLSTPLGDTPTT